VIKDITLELQNNTEFWNRWNHVDHLCAINHNKKSSWDHVSTGVVTKPTKREMRVFEKRKEKDSTFVFKDTFLTVHTVFSLETLLFCNGGPSPKNFITIDKVRSKWKIYIYVGVMRRYIGRHIIGEDKDTRTGPLYATLL
jgi:hypothetical protein